MTKVDAIEGEGTQEDPYVISGEGEYALTYPLDPSSTDANVVYMDTIYVTIDGSTVYNLTADDFGFTYPMISYEDPDVGSMQMGLSYGFQSNPSVEDYWMENAVVVTVEEAEPGTTQYNPIELQINGQTTVNDTSEWGAPYYYTFTAEKDGDYTVYATNTSVQITVNGGLPASDVNGRGATNEFEAEAGETYVIEVNGWGSKVYDIYLIEGTRPDYDQPDSGSGTESDPYVVSKALTYQAEVPANGSVYYSINSDSRFTVTVEDAGVAQVNYNGETYTANADGGITFVTDADVTGIEFTTSDGAALAYNFSLTEYVVYEPIAAEGTELVGTMLVPGENTVTEGADFFTPANYYFVPAQSGDYKVSVSGAQFAFDYYNAQFGSNDQYFMYDGDSTVIYMKAGTVYAFYSYTAGTVTFTPVDVAYDSYTGEGREDSRFILGGAGSGIGAYEITIGSNTTLYFSYGATSELTVSTNSTAVSAFYNGTTYAADGETPFSFTSAAPLGIGSVTFSVTNNTNETVTIVLYVSQVYTLTAPGEGGDEPVESDFVVGVNENVEIHASDFWDNSGTHYTFVATEAGTYTFDVVPATGVVSLAVYNAGGYWETLFDDTGANMTSYTVSLGAGESFEIAIALDQSANAFMPIDGTVTVTITQA